jgi:hypothetical protein
MSATLTRAVAPILKIRAALRERASRPEAAAANVVSITDRLMLGWAENEVAVRKEARANLAAVQDELSDLRQLAAAIVTGEREVSPLEKLLVFTKLESAAGLARQTFNTLALCSLALVMWVAVQPDEEHDEMNRAPRGTRIVRIVRNVRGAKREGLLS